MSFENLPIFILGHISKFLPLKSLFSFGISCKKSSKIFSNELLWKELAKREFGEEVEKPDEKQTWKQFVKEGFFEW